MIVRVPTIVVKIEGGVGRRTVPLLITEMTFEGEVRDWSGKVCAHSNGKKLHGLYLRISGVFWPSDKKQ